MEDQEAGRAEVRRVTLFGGLVDALLTVVKAVVGVLANSAALLVDAVHSAADLATDIVVYIAVRIGGKEPDENHPYGHRRFETITTLLLGVVIIVTGVGIVLEMLSRIQTAELSEPMRSALLVAFGSVIVKEGLYRYTARVGLRLDHSLLMANAVHHRSDVLSSIVVFCGLIAAQLGWPAGDVAAALVVGVMLVRVGAMISYDALLEISEAGADPETLGRINASIMGTSGVEDVHLIKTRRMAGDIYAEAHVQVASHITVTHGHEIAHRVIDAVSRAVPEVRELTVHVDPEDDEIMPIELPSSADIIDLIETTWSEDGQGQGPVDHRIHLLSTGVEIELIVDADTPVERLNKMRDRLIDEGPIDEVRFLSRMD